MCRQNPIRDIYRYTLVLSTCMVIRILSTELNIACSDIACVTCSIIQITVFINCMQLQGFPINSHTFVWGRHMILVCIKLFHRLLPSVFFCWMSAGDMGLVTSVTDPQVEEGDCRFLPREILQEVHDYICGSPIWKSKVIPSHISIALLPLKHCITELPLRTGLICAS